MGNVDRFEINGDTLRLQGEYWQHFLLQERQYYEYYFHHAVETKNGNIKVILYPLEEKRNNDGTIYYSLVKSRYKVSHYLNDNEKMVFKDYLKTNAVDGKLPNGTTWYDIVCK